MLGERIPAAKEFCDMGNRSCRGATLALVGVALFLAACSGNGSSSNAMVPAGRFMPDARSHGPLVPVTPPPNGSQYYYQFSKTSTTQSSNVSDAMPQTIATGTIQATWSLGDGGFELSLTTEPSLGSFEWEQSVKPFLQPGTYAFTSANGSLKEAYYRFSYAYKAVGEYRQIAQSQEDAPAKVVANFPLVAEPAYNAAVNVRIASSYDSYAHADSWGSSKVRINADGSYTSWALNAHDNVLTKTTSSGSVASTGTGQRRDCTYTARTGSICTGRAWGLPLRRNGASAIPLTTTTKSRTSTRYVPDWYPHGAVALPLASDTIAVSAATIPSNCSTYAGQAAMATVETIAALDPVAGTITSSTSSAYYAPGNVMLVCGVASQRVEYFDNLGTGRRRKTVTTITTVEMTTKPTPTPSPTPLTPQTLYVGVGNTAYPKGHVYVFSDVRPGATPNAVIEADTTGNQLSLSDLGVDSAGNVYTQFGSAAPRATTFTGAGLSPSINWVLAGGTVYQETAAPNIAYFPIAAGTCGPSCSVISGSKTMLSNNVTVAVDESGDIWESDFNAHAIFAFAPGASGNVAPLETIYGSNTQLGYASAMAFDSARRLWLDNAGQIYFFLPGAIGNAAAIPVTLASNGTPAGLAVDRNDNVYVDVCNPQAETCWIQVVKANNGGQFSIPIPIGIGDAAQSITLGAPLASAATK
jgi:hypothetical protein